MLVRAHTVAFRHGAPGNGDDSPTVVLRAVRLGHVAVEDEVTDDHLVMDRPAREDSRW